MHYKPGCRSNSKFGIIVSVTTTLYAALANRYHNKLFFCAGFPLFSKKCWKMPDKTPPWPPRRLGPGEPSGGPGRPTCRKMRKIIHLQHHNKNTSFKKLNFFSKLHQRRPQILFSDYTWALIVTLILATTASRTFNTTTTTATTTTTTTTTTITTITTITTTTFVWIRNL